MNQHQRKFLLDEIDKLARKEHEKLRERKPVAPSLNNYLIAAVLDGSVVLKTQSELRNTIRQRVRDLGKQECLVAGSSRYGVEDALDQITLPALALFEEPPAFAEVRARYAKELEQWEASKAALDASVNAMRIKIQVGSDKALESLVAQADRLCSMSLTRASQLMLEDKR